jgi:hypothetical protein
MAGSLYLAIGIEPDEADTERGYIVPGLYGVQGVLSLNLGVPTIETLEARVLATVPWKSYRSQTT